VTVALRPLRIEEFDAWRSGSLERYAADIERNGGYTRERAALKAAQDFDQVLPDGLDTTGQHIWAVERADVGVIGHAWIGERDVPEGGRMAFVYEIEIGEAQRGQGHGRAAMILLEAEARSLGHGRIELNVFGGNAVARGLYSSLGYSEIAVYMGKELQ
jgi:RimJ/RimL family protein N-acetyltransferase